MHSIPCTAVLISFVCSLIECTEAHCCICRSIRLSVRPSVCIYVCLSVPDCVCPSVCLSVLWLSAEFDVASILVYKFLESSQVLSEDINAGDLVSHPPVSPCISTGQPHCALFPFTLLQMWPTTWLVQTHKIEVIHYLIIRYLIQCPWVW